MRSSTLPPSFPPSGVNLTLCSDMLQKRPDLLTKPKRFEIDIQLTTESRSRSVIAVAAFGESNPSISDDPQGGRQQRGLPRSGGGESLFDGPLAAYQRVCLQREEDGVKHNLKMGFIILPLTPHMC